MRSLAVNSCGDRFLKGREQPVFITNDDYEARLARFLDLRFWRGSLVLVSNSPFALFPFYSVFSARLVEPSCDGSGRTVHNSHIYVTYSILAPQVGIRERSNYFGF